jgi:hypothetical protein
MRSPFSCRRTSGSRVFGLSGKRLLRLFPQLKRALALRQAKLGVTRSVRPQKINALDDHRNSVERNWLTGQFPGSKCLGAGANQYARGALFLWWQTRSQFEVGAHFEGNLRVEQNARARDVTRLTCVELRQPVLSRADVRAILWPSMGSCLIETKVVAAGLYSRYPSLTLQALPSCGPICTDGMRELIPVFS